MIIKVNIDNIFDNVEIQAYSNLLDEGLLLALLTQPVSRSKTIQGDHII
jgi:hypothetical protein